MTHEVQLLEMQSHPTAVVTARVAPRALPDVWPGLLGEVWACLNVSGITSGCPNVMVYRDVDGVLEIEVGVELRQPCALTGRVVASVLPSGNAAMTVHRGPYSQLGSAHQALAEWCAQHGYTSDTRWEVYGPHNEDPALVTTEVYWLLSRLP